MIEDIARLHVGGVRLVHGRLPAWDATDYVSVSTPTSVALSFSAQRGFTQSTSESSVARVVPPNSLGAAGAEAIAWLRTDGPSEFLEVTVSHELRLSVARTSVFRAADLEAIHDTDEAHPIAWAICARLRSATRGGSDPDALEIDTLTRALYAHVLSSRLGGRLPAGRGVLGQLADVAALSPFLPARTTGVSSGSASSRSRPGPAAPSTP